MNQDARMSYRVLFCALIAARRSRASTGDVLAVLPESGRAALLARRPAAAHRAQEASGVYGREEPAAGFPAAATLTFGV